MSWVSLEDAVGAVDLALTDTRLEGPINVTAPEPVTNREFTRTLARVLSRPAAFVVPEPALRLALGKMADGTLLSSARVLPARLMEAGYRFAHPDLESALRHVLGKNRTDNFPR
jgi:NAD dependent epimerase/dehydratase family enzyme